MILHDVNFPDELAEQLKTATGACSLTKAVRSACFGYVSAASQIALLQSEIGQLRAKFSFLLDGVKSRDEGERRFRDAVSRVSSPDCFFLEVQEK